MSVARLKRGQGYLEYHPSNEGPVLEVAFSQKTVVGAAMASK